MKKLLIAAAAVVLTACGGGGADSPESPPATSRTNLLFLGNSLTYYPTSATYNGDISQWGQGGWGMAASAPEKDFVHIVATAQKLPFIAMNLADNERDGAAPLPAFTVGAGTVVVLQLGDNGLAAKYSELVGRAKAGAKVVCLSSWGSWPDRDAAMKSQCQASGGTWVDISDLRQSSINVGAYGHPNDTGMAQIAARINAALL
jgi:hypothetical protein